MSSHSTEGDVSGKGHGFQPITNPTYPHDSRFMAEYQMIDIMRNPLFINTSQTDPHILISTVPPLAQTIITSCLNYCSLLLANLPASNVASVYNLFSISNSQSDIF